VTVYLVGAGPGDPGLLTLRGAEVLARADVVVHDRLSAASLLDLAPSGAERIDVGKAPGHARLDQTGINALLVERGRRGEEVVRLKGGDPFVFARGGEEAAALEAAGVAYEVVPGISSALAAPAYAGIPVTLRFSSTAFTVITGHEDPAAGEGTVDWEAAARLGGTLVVLMGVARWPRIARRLLDAGMAPDTPAAAVRWGTRPDQTTVRATLATLGDHPLESPSVIVVGRVAATELEWFTRRPLFGRRVVVTRTRHQASELSRRLRDLGAEPIEVPVIETVAPSDDGAALRAALTGVGLDGSSSAGSSSAALAASEAGSPAEAGSSVDAGSGSADPLADVAWIAFTSPNGVAAAFEHVPDSRALAGVRVAAIGPGTAAALAERRIVADLIPDRYVAEALLDAFPDPPAAAGIAGGSAAGARAAGAGGADGTVGPEGSDRRRVLIVRAEEAREVLPEGLRARGWDVAVVPAYRTVAAAVDGDRRAAVAAADAVTFTSSSTVTRFVEAFGADAVPPVVACIGPITAATARGHGIAVTVEADEHTIPGLVAALRTAL